MEPDYDLAIQQAETLYRGHAGYLDMVVIPLAALFGPLEPGHRMKLYVTSIEQICDFDLPDRAFAISTHHSQRITFPLTDDMRRRMLEVMQGTWHAYCRAGLQNWCIMSSLTVLVATTQAAQARRVRALAEIRHQLVTNLRPASPDSANHTPDEARERLRLAQCV